jgi:murein DD-endopeptidase MepM/ murein hydrolase activator NlpD
MQIVGASLIVGMVAAIVPPAKSEPWNWQDPDVTEKDHPPERDVIGYFPIATDPANYYYTNTFLACRAGCTRPHLGVDVLTRGVKGYPVVAFDDGVVSWISDTCCSLHITFDDGWSVRYIHLNNDTPGTDDGLGEGIAPGIERGTRVTAGQLIGWAGDSGNAENVSPHLHFEIIDPEGRWHDPTPYVDRAVKLTAPIPDDPEEGERPCDDAAVCDSAGFVDSGGDWSIMDRLSAESDTDDFYYGNPGDVPFMGDWDGDGVATPGLYRRSDGFVYLRNSNTQGVADITFFFGNPGDYPLVGDFDGDGKDTVSIYRGSEGRVYVMNELGEDGGGLGAADFGYYFGNPGDSPFVGDFDGDGIDTVGLYRTSTGYVYFRDSLTQGTADFEFFYGNPGDVILAGDWDNDGDDTVAVFRPSTGRVYVNLENEPGVADYTLYVGSYAAAVTYRRNSE